MRGETRAVRREATREVNEVADMTYVSATGGGTLGDKCCGAVTASRGRGGARSYAVSADTLAMIALERSLRLRPPSACYACVGRSPTSIDVDVIVSLPCGQRFPASNVGTARRTTSPGSSSYLPSGGVS